jgi:hypothetical protein
MQSIQRLLIAGAMAACALPAFAAPVSAIQTHDLSGTGVVDVTGANGGNNGGQDKNREAITISVVDGVTPVAAKCTLTNEHGDWSLNAPDTVTVRRASSALQVKCLADGYAPAETSIEAANIKIPKPHFHFSTDAGGDGDDNGDGSEAMITVPNYRSNITVVLGPKTAAGAN